MIIDFGSTMPEKAITMRKWDEGKALGILVRKCGKCSTPIGSGPGASIHVLCLGIFSIRNVGMSFIEALTKPNDLMRRLWPRPQTLPFFELLEQMKESSRHDHDRAQWAHCKMIYRYTYIHIKSGRGYIAFTRSLWIPFFSVQSAKIGRSTLFFATKTMVAKRGP